MRRYIFYIIFFLLGLAFTAFVYAQGSPSQKWVNAIESYFNGTNYVNVSSTNPLPILAEPSTNTIGTVNQGLSRGGDGWWVTLLNSNGNYISPTYPLPVQQASSTNPPANPNEFYYQGQISSSLSGINACIVPTSGHTMYLTHVILQDIEAAGTTSNWQAGIAVGLSGGTSTSGTMSAVNTTVSTFAAPVVNSYSAAPTFTSFYNFLFLFNSAPATITSEVQRSISLAGTAELPIAAAVSSQGQEICFYDNTAGQEVSFMIEGYEQ